MPTVPCALCATWDGASTSQAPAFLIFKMEMIKAPASQADRDDSRGGGFGSTAMHDISGSKLPPSAQIPSDQGLRSARLWPQVCACGSATGHKQQLLTGLQL